MNDPFKIKLDKQLKFNRNLKGKRQLAHTYSRSYRSKRKAKYGSGNDRRRGIQRIMDRHERHYYRQQVKCGIKKGWITGEADLPMSPGKNKDCKSGQTGTRRRSIRYSCFNV